VVVGQQIRWSKSWLTFHDFLFDHIKVTLGREWGTREIAKPESDRHPLIVWYQRVCEFQRSHAASRAGNIYSGQMTGLIRAYLGLAYDLYLCAHNVELPELLVTRLRNHDNFEGALYEAFVVGCFAKAGFTIEFENEADSSVSHCEFTATHKDTRRRFSVEAKAVTSASGRAGTSDQPPRIRDKLYDALRKDAEHERIIFVELNRAQTVNDQGEPDWAAQVDQEMRLAESELTIARQPAPPAYVFVTNRVFMQKLDDPEGGEMYMARGFKIADFPPGRGATSILEAVEARERHMEIHWLMKALQTQSQIPSTFDDRTPEEVFAPDQSARLRIGETYLVPDADGKEVPGLHPVPKTPS
jgi:hypothetical protein